MSSMIQEKNKALVLEAFDTLFNKRDYIVGIADGVLTEHWDVIQDEVTQEQSKSGLPMFGDRFPGLAL